MSKDKRLAGLPCEEVELYMRDMLHFIENIGPARKRFDMRWSESGLVCSIQPEGVAVELLLVEEEDSPIKKRVARLWAKPPRFRREYELMYVGDLHDYLMLFLAPDVASLHSLHLLSSGLFTTLGNDEVAARYRAAMSADFRIELKEQEEEGLQFWLHTPERSMRIALGDDLRLLTTTAEQPQQPLKKSDDDDDEQAKRKLMQTGAGFSFGSPAPAEEDDDEDKWVDRSIEYSCFRSCYPEDKKKTLPLPEFLPRTQEMLVWLVNQADEKEPPGLARSRSSVHK